MLALRRSSRQVVVADKQLDRTDMRGKTRLAAIRWVRLNKRTETAIDRYDDEIGHFLCGFSSKKGIDIETIVLAE
jgi:hypothetical protein